MEDMEIDILFIFPVFVGLAVGVFSGLLGIGGGAIMIPLFRLLFSMTPVMSAATSLFAIVPTAASGTISHVRHKTCLPALGVAAGLGGALTSPVGVWLGQKSPSWMIMVAAALVIGWSAFKMLRKACKLSERSLSETGGKVKSDRGISAKNTDLSGNNPPVKLTRRQLLVGAGIGLIAGLASGYVGVGGAFILVPMMLSFIGIGMKQASGTSLIAVMILTIPGVIEQMFLGNVNYTIGIAMALGSVPGAIIGAQLVRRVPERVLRFTFGLFLLGSAVLLVVNEFSLLG